MSRIFLRKGEKNYLNLNKERNAENTDNEEYNCGGYAMGTLTWILLDSFEYRDDREIWDDEEFAEEIADECVEEIIDYFEGLVRTINDFSELKNDEYAVLFRISYDDDGYIDDYHFIKRHHDGHFTHKPGRSLVQNYIGDPLKGVWEHPFVDYNSKIHIFAVSNLLY